MPRQLKISLGQHSDKGRKDSNQDFHGACVPAEPQLTSKGIALAIADGVSSSQVSRVASEAAVRGFLEDYFCTSAAWSVKRSAQAVLMATNSWLYAQTRQSQYRYDQDRGYVCTLSALVVKLTTAHIFHVGDARIYRLRGKSLERLTEDHRVWISSEQNYLGRALGINPHLEIDYQTCAVETGDVFVLATDGVHEHLDDGYIATAIAATGHDLNAIARDITMEALRRGSNDNLTLQIARIDELPDRDVSELGQQVTELPLPPQLEARALFDGYTILRELHFSSRSHVYLAMPAGATNAVVLKTPSTDLHSDSKHLERFMLEDWIARRINNAHVVKAFDDSRQRHYLYTVTEYIDGQTLRQWMIDNPRAALETVRGIVEQIARGLLAFHRLEMLHQDLRPENVMIDRGGTAKIVDFGSTRVAGLVEGTFSQQPDLLGTAQYAAPEYFLGEAGSTRSDLFSLGVITYQMLSGRLPFGTEIARTRTRAAQKNLIYDSVLDDHREIPVWIDEVLRKATHPDPNKRYAELSEFIHDLRHPTAAYLSKSQPPLIERNPIAFWKMISLLLAIFVIVLLFR